MTAVFEDPFAVSLALRAPEPLRAFNAAGVLGAGDVHVARVLESLAGQSSGGTGGGTGGTGAGAGEVALAAALAVRAPRLGHVFVDLATISKTAAVETEETVDLSALPWPEPEAWVAAVEAAAELVAVGEEDSGSGAVRPLRLVGSRLYLDRYWREERMVADRLSDLAGAAPRAVDLNRLADGLARLLPVAGDGLQRAAAACAVLRGLAVIAGGPGTGKTTTVARVAALLAEEALATGGSPPLIALCAPTGKAAARLQEAVRQEGAALAVAPEVREWLQALRATTIHRLLGWRPGSHSRFRHDAANRLPHDVVIVDETSMVALSLMGRLLEAVRAGARLVLVGDPDQLTAIEAGAVLRDIVGPATAGLRMGAGAQGLIGRVAGVELPSSGLAAPVGGFGDGVVVLERGHRFGESIAALAAAIRRGDGDGAVAAIGAGDEAIAWLQVDVEAGEPGGAAAAGVVDAGLVALRDAAVTAGAAVLDASQVGDGARALRELGAFRLLCAHRRGPYGVARWTAQIERWLLDALDGFEPSERDYVGRPLLVGENDYELRLYNGDTGVVVRSGPERLSAVFERDGEIVSFAPSRLASVQTLHAMTIHKSQGSQFATAAVLLPDPSSRILTRELLYTAVTRARRRLILVGTEESLREAVARPVARATGLRERLWRA